MYHITVVQAPESLTLVGPLIPGAWSRHDDELGRKMTGEFLIDTGAYGPMIDADVALSLDLSVGGMREVHGIHGYGWLQLYLAKLVLPAKDLAGKDCFFEQVMECVGIPSLLEKNRQHDAQVIGILGRAFLQTANLEIDGRLGHIKLSLRDLVQA
jgi:hypothetical protein